MPVITEAKLGRTPPNLVEHPLNFNSTATLLNACVSKRHGSNVGLSGMIWDDTVSEAIKVFEERGRDAWEPVRVVYHGVPDPSGSGPFVMFESAQLYGIHRRDVYTEPNGNQALSSWVASVTGKINGTPCNQQLDLGEEYSFYPAQKGQDGTNN